MQSIVVKLAGVNINIKCNYESTIDRFQDFITNDTPSIRVNISQERVISEKRCLLEQYPEDIITCHEAEFNAIYRDLSELLLERGVFVYHGVLVEKDNIGYLFTSPSGVGKTTHALFWIKTFGHNACIVNGDKPLLRMTSEGVRGFGSPWKGKENFGNNGSVPLKFICHLSRGKRTSIREITSKESALDWLINGVMLKNRTQRIPEVIHKLNVMLPFVSLYELQCTKEPESAKVAYDAMK